MGQVGDQFQSSDGRWHDSASAANDWNLQSNAGGGPDKLTMAEVDAAVAVGKAGLFFVKPLLAIIVPIATLIGTVAGILPGVILALLFKIPLLGRVIHTALFAFIAAFLLFSVCWIFGTATGQWDLSARESFMSTLPVFYICLAVGLVTAMVFYWRKFYHWIKLYTKDDGLWGVIRPTTFALGIYVIGLIIGFIVQSKTNDTAFWIIHSIFMVLAFIYWYTDIKDYKPYTEEEIQKMKRAAESGDPKAQYVFAEAYISTRGIRDTEKGIMWMEKAAAQGYKKAIEYLSSPWLSMAGNFYTSCVKDEKEVALLTRLAEAGNPNIQYALGYAHKNELGYLKKHGSGKQGRMWMEKAAAQGQKAAIDQMNKWAEEGDFTSRDFLASLSAK